MDMETATDFATEVRDWIRENRIEGLPRDGDVWGMPEPGSPMARWVQLVRERGWLCASWPTDYGGGGLGPLEVNTLDEQFALAGVPRPMLGFGEALVGPALIAHGTEEQKRRLLPRIIDLQDFYCQGFSEPNAGSDLAGVTTRGVIDGDKLRISGQKIWTSEAATATWCFVLCRTEPSEVKHRGLTFVLVPMADNGVEVRPIRQVDGRADYCEVFFDDSVASLDDVIGGLGNGWAVTMTTLGAERSMGYASRHFEFMLELRDVLESLAGSQRMDDPLVRQELAQAYTLIEVVRALGMSQMTRLLEGAPEGPEGTIYKYVWSDAHRAMGRHYLRAVGAQSAVRAEGDAYALSRPQDVLMLGEAETIYAGTSEIQRNIISERLLGLPKERRA